MATTLAYVPTALSTGVCKKDGLIDGVPGDWRYAAINWTQYEFSAAAWLDCAQSSYGGSMVYPTAEILPEKNLFRRAPTLTLLSTYVPVDANREPFYSMPRDISNLLPEWRGCSGVFNGIYDPPGKLTRRDAMVPPTSSSQFTYPARTTSNPGQTVKPHAPTTTLTQLGASEYHLIENQLLPPLIMQPSSDPRAQRPARESGDMPVETHGLGKTDGDPQPYVVSTPLPFHDDGPAYTARPVPNDFDPKVAADPGDNDVNVAGPHHSPPNPAADGVIITAGGAAYTIQPVPNAFDPKVPYPGSSDITAADSAHRPALNLVVDGVTITAGGAADVLPDGRTIALNAAGNSLLADGAAHTIPSVSNAFDPKTAGPGVSDVTEADGPHHSAPVALAVDGVTITAGGSANVLSDGRTISLNAAGNSWYANGTAYPVPSFSRSPTLQSETTPREPTAVDGSIINSSQYPEASSSNDASRGNGTTGLQFTGGGSITFGKFPELGYGACVCWAMGSLVWMHH